MSDLIVHLKKLAELRDSGILTEDEFQSQKREALSRASSPRRVTALEPSATPEPFPGMLGSYLLLEQIGEGGMGRVVRARHKEEGWAKRQGDVAIKLIASDLASSPAYRERFLQEASVGKDIRHKSIAQVHDVLLEQSWLGIVMELVEGHSLEDFITPGGLSENRALQLLRPLAEAVDYLHSKGIIHRDLKPENIKVRSDGTPVILDFGIAQVENASKRHTQTLTMMGTVDWMAPEQVDAKSVGSAADRYALGLIAYVLLSGQMPWDAELGIGSLIALKSSGDLTPLPRGQLSASTPAAVKRMLSLTPAERYPTCLAFVDALQSSPGLQDEVAPQPLPPSISTPPVFSLHDTISLSPSKPPDAVPEVRPLAQPPAQPLPKPPPPRPAATRQPTPRQPTPPQPPPSSSSKRWLALPIGLLVFGVMGLGLLGLVGVILSSSEESDEPLVVVDAEVETDPTMMLSSQAFPASGSSSTLLVATGKLFEPMFDTTGSEPSGFDISLAKEIAQRVGRTARFVTVSSARRSAAAGDVDIGIQAISITPDRAKEALYSVPYISSQFVLVAAVDKAAGIRSLALGGRTCSVGPNAVYRAELKKTGCTMVSTRSTSEALSAARKGEVELTITDIANSDSLDGLVSTEVSTGSDAYGIAMRLGNSELKSAIDEIILQMQSDGTMAQLRYDHGL